MVRARIAGVFCTYKILKDGSRREYWYHRRSGKKLRGTPNTPEFVVDYAEAEQAASRPQGDDFNALVRRYSGSVEFGKLALSTQTEYKRMLTKAEPVFGDLTFAAISDPRVRKEFLEWREKIAREAGEREADDRLSVVSAMFSWATDRGHIAVNHLRGFRRLYHSNRSENIWLPEHISPFMRVASIEMLRAMIIALHTGQRQGDILRLPWSSYDTTILEKYLARTRHLSDDAIDNFENSPRTEFANRLQTKTPQGRKKNDKP